MVADTIGNYIITLKNAAIARKETFSVPFSKLKMAITDVLEKEGYVTNLTKHSHVKAAVKSGPLKEIEIALIYNGDKAKVKGVERMSRPSKRLYKSATGLDLVKSGVGHYIVSTSKGVKTGRDARKSGLGGEVLFKIW